MQRYKTYFSNKSFLVSFFGGMLLLAVSLVMQFFVSGYVTRSMSGSVTDIVLSNTRVYDVGGIFVWGSVILVVVVVTICFRQINYVPFVAKSIALFTLIRSFFVSLTHISPFPTRAAIESAFFSKNIFEGIFTGNDLFFSGHTGIPFLLALIFWENKKLRYLFLGWSVLFALVVLLGHLHYTIDVASAYFITFSIYSLCKFLFKRELRFFKEVE